MAARCQAPNCKDEGKIHISILGKGQKMWVCLPHAKEYQK